MIFISDEFIRSAECEIVSSREFSVPVEVLFRAWTEPQHLKQWWGPEGFSNTFLEYDLQVGGKWKFIMHGPDKGNYPNEIEFLKIEKPFLLAWKRISKPWFIVVALFEKVSSEKSRVAFKMLFDSEKECNKIKKFAVGKNEENFDRLETVLKNMMAIE